MTSYKQSARVLQKTIHEMAETESRAIDAWNALQRLNVMPDRLLGYNTMALVEMHELLGQMLERIGIGKE